MTNEINIRIRYRSLDRFSQSRTFKTLAGAQRYAQKWVGQTPDISEAFGYAVSDDGIGKITVSGCSLKDLFPQSFPQPGSGARTRPRR